MRLCYHWWHFLRKHVGTSLFLFSLILCKGRSVKQAQLNIACSGSNSNSWSSALGPSLTSDTSKDAPLTTIRYGRAGYWPINNSRMKTRPVSMCNVSIRPWTVQSWGILYLVNIASRAVSAILITVQCTWYCFIQYHSLQHWLYSPNNNEDLWKY